MGACFILFVPSSFLPFIFGGEGVHATPERSLADTSVISISPDALQRERKRRPGGMGGRGGLRNPGDSFWFIKN